MAKTILGIFIGTIVATLLLGVAWVLYEGLIWLWDSARKRVDVKDLDSRRRAIWLHFKKVK